MPEQQTYLTPDIAPRLAAIDIGSNSIRLVVAESDPRNHYRVLDEERETTRLGRALAAHGCLDETSMAATVDALRRFQAIAAGLQAEQVRAIATCAVREAENGQEFCDLVRAQLGLEIDVISAEEEADLAFQSVRRRSDLTGKNTLLADIGGGSTEIVIASGEFVESVYATPLGAVRLTEKFAAGQSLAGDNYGQMVRWIDRELRRSCDKPSAPLHLMVGSGGTFTSLGAMVMAARGLSRLPAAGCQASRADVRHLIDRLRKMPAKLRREMPGLSADRADIIVPGLVVIDRIMRRFRVNVLQVHPYGVRDGMLLQMFDALRGDGTPAPFRLDEQLDRFADMCGADAARGKYVAELAAQIYDAVALRFHLDPHDVRLLRTAARLQDVGYLIGYEKHHKHSYHLILHSRLDAFRPEEIELIANVARYHRGSEPKNRHENFRKLAPPDRHRVRVLAGVLRIAGGLDRSHNRTVRAVQAGGAGRVVELAVSAAESPEVDLWAARRRVGLLETALDAEISVEWAGNLVANY
jgi:exopolyphosphatase/guanosine-5'-triphosphate,3'-diphosphate pyrophosphatase